MYDVYGFGRFFRNLKAEAAWEELLNGRIVDLDWFKLLLEQRSKAIEGQYRYSGRARFRDAHLPLDDIPNSSLDLLAGRCADAVREFLLLCSVTGLRLPSVDPKLSGGEEPCGIKITHHNLFPEYVRHFLGTFYSRHAFNKGLSGADFFLFENRDHLIHSLQVALLGRIVMEAPVDDIAKNAVAKALNKTLKTLGKKVLGRHERTALESCQTVRALAACVYNLKHSHMGRPGIAVLGEGWMDWAWAEIALWHDAGYDTETWFLLTVREFSHCHAVSECDPTEWLLNRLRVLETALTGLVDDSIFDVLQNPLEDPYHLLFQIHECFKTSSSERPWGRLHALMSAYEVLSHLREDTGYNKKLKQDITDAPEPLKLIAAAIAEHHEAYLDPVLPTGDKPSSKNAESKLRKELAEQFVRNPFGQLLRFVDTLAVGNRVKLTWSDQSAFVDMSGRGGSLRFSMDFNSDPVLVRNRDGAWNERPEFLKCHKLDQVAAKKYALWGTILDRADPPELNKCLFGKACVSRAAR